LANFTNLRLTDAGLNLLTNVQAGADNLTFTKMVLGDGELSTPISKLTALVNPKIECVVTSGKQVGTSTYQIGAVFSNLDILTGFWWRELGVYAKGNDNTEILYCYSNAGDAGDYIPVGSDERIEKNVFVSLAVGNAENVTVEISGSDTFITVAEKGEAGGVVPLNEDGKIDDAYLPDMDYAGSVEFKTLSQDVSAHTTNKSNPHGVTASQVGLGSVPNVATNDQTPTYTEASTLATLTSGEKISVAFGKIKKAITDLISHLADATRHITAAERTTWNSKAPTSHASTSTTYGVGTSSNYGHLKITDSVSSTATDTAASAKAVKSAYDVAEANGYKLLKTQSISFESLKHSSSKYTDYKVNITGVNWTDYDEIVFKFEGTATTSSATTNWKIVYAGILGRDQDQQATTYGVDFVRYNYYGTGATATFPLKSKAVLRIIPSCDIKVENNGSYSEDSNGLGYARGYFDSTNFENDTLVFYAETNSASDSTAYSKLTGTLYIYGKKGV